MADINITESTIDINITEQVIEILSPTGGYPLPSSVYSVFGRVGNVVAVEGDYNLTQLGDVTITTPSTGQVLRYNGTAWVNNTETYVGTVTSVSASVPTGLTIAGSPITSSGTLAFGLDTGYVIPLQSTLDAKALKSITISTTAPITGGGDLSANRTFAIAKSTGSVDGYLAATDFTIFNNKENAIASGTTSQYWRGDKSFQTLNTTAVTEGTNLYYTQARFDTAFSNKSTTNLVEGTNLYYTDVRARASNSFVAGSGAYNSTTGVITIPTNTNQLTNGAAYITLTSLSATSPLSYVNTTGVFSISQSNTSTNGFLSSTDWNTFNSKQPALNGTGFVKISGTTISYDNSTYLTTISGITAGGELSGTYANPSLVNSAVIGKVLTGVNITGGTIAATDSILTAFGKVQNQINGLIGGSIYKGTWNATTNNPALTSSVGTAGNYYIVSVAGSTNLDGITDWQVGDWVIYQGTEWEKVDNTDAVVSVNGFTGAVSLSSSNIAEGTNLYFTNARTIASTLTGYTSGAGTITSSDTILTAIQKLNGNIGSIVSGVSSVFGRTGAVVATEGDYSLTQLSDVAITSPSTNQVLKYNGTGWVNSTDSGLTSVGVSMPSAFSVSGSPLTSNGTIAITGAGDSLQYIDGTGALQTFPTLLSSDSLVKLVRNQSGATMNAGTIVYISGATGNKPLISKALATGDSTSAQTYGLLQTNIANNADGYIVLIGNVNNLDTSALTEGQQLYLSGTTAGTWTTTKPYAPIHLVYIGIVLRSHPTQGIIGVKIQNGYEMDELHNVDAYLPSNNDILSYNTTTNLWEHKQIATTLGYTPIALTSLSSSATGLTYTNTTGVFSLTAGYVIPTTSSATNWDNAYTNRITSLTTTGSSGAATLVSNTLNIPTYTLTGLGGQPLATNLTSLSGLSYVSSSFVKMTAAGTFTLDTTAYGLGSVTSVAALTLGTTGTDFSSSVVNGTTTPVITLNIPTASATNRGALSSADWSTFNSKQSALTNPVTGTGTTNYLSKFTGTSTIGNSLIWDNGTNVGIGNTNTSYTLDVSGTINATKTLTLRGQTDPTSGVGMELFYRTADTSSYLQSYDRTGSAWKDVRIYGNALYIGTQGNNTLTIASNGTTTLSGDLTIAARMYIKGGNQNSIWFNQNAGGSSTGFLVGRSLANTDAQDFFIYDIAAATARLQITSGGWSKISNSGTYVGVASPYHEIQSNQNNNAAVVVSNSNNTFPYGVYMLFTGTSPNDSTRWFYNGEDTTATRFTVKSNGGIANYQANNTNLSDIKTKKDIIPLESYWNKFKAIEIVKFKYKDQTHDDYNIGLIAQQLETIAPEFIDKDGWGKQDKDSEPLWSIYNEDLHNATIKVLQEAMTKIEEQQIQIQNLQEQNQDLKSRLDKAGL